MIDSIALWHKRARPNPDHDAFNVQLGCHMEEFGEMLASLNGEDGISSNKLASMAYQVMQMAEGFKRGAVSAYAEDQVELLDSLADQIVTAVGVGHCAKLNMVKGVEIVNTSNWSKYDSNGNPLFDENGKITKGPNYTAPYLKECV